MEDNQPQPIIIIVIAVLLVPILIALTAEKKDTMKTCNDKEYSKLMEQHGECPLDENLDKCLKEARIAWNGYCN